MIVIDIPERLPTLNQLMRMHWSRRGKWKRRLAWMIRAACAPPAQPLARCRVLVERTSPTEPDADNLHACAKFALDVLQPATKTNPMGLGFIVNDNPACIESLVVRHVQGNASHTRVTIEAIP